MESFEIPSATLLMKQCFGARAPVLEIAWQILYDCPPYFSVMTEDGSEKKVLSVSQKSTMPSSIPSNIQEKSLV
jgi:hypothetical protein